MRILILGLTLLVGWCGTIVFSGCSRCQAPDDETQIRLLFDQAAEMAGNHQLKELMALTTEDFRAWPGNRDRRSVKGVLFMAFRKYGAFQVQFPRPTIHLDPSNSFAEAKTPFVIVREGKPMPELTELVLDPESWVAQVDEKADLYQLEIWLIKQDGQWRVRKAKVGGFGV